ncbi:MAG: hypothetical protein JST36_05935, partial [Bacteroidetes bacterium]|nr:hypothetical protein [Bacteroidota bacterium]
MAKYYTLLLGFIFCCCKALAGAAPDAPRLSQGHPAFIPNKGQVHDARYQALPQVLYQFSGSGLNISLTKNALHYTFIRELSTPNRKATPFDTTSTQYTCLGVELR